MNLPFSAVEFIFYCSKKSVYNKVVIKFSSKKKITRAADERGHDKILLYIISRPGFHVEIYCMFLYDFKAHTPTPAEGAERMTMLQ